MSVAEETRITAKEAAELLDVSEVTVRSYAKNGVRGICLEHISRPKKWETSKEAVKRFLDAITVTNTSPVETVPSHEEEKARLDAETSHLRGRNRRRERSAK